MIGKSQSDRKPVTSAEALAILEDRKEDGELGYEQKLAYEHMKKFVTASPDDAKKMVKELMEYGVSESTAIKIADIMPIEVTQLKHILAKEKKTFEEDEVGKMMEVVKGHRGK
ncbi:MAG: DNA-directed RNA polymerase subunit F [Candidatus Micrarchaeota archaeon]|nr:DNA-directed RNA polymerase subunit F [Candidatus Micrarchaeota archaeon]